jgi:DNA-binding transcriptional ArsR family regulator
MKTMTEAKPLPMEILDKAASVLRALAHPHRLRIIELLSGGPMNVTDLGLQARTP